MTRADPLPLFQRVSRGGVDGLRCNWHDGQKRVLRSKKRIVAVIAGGQSGKTVIGPMWLFREMARHGPGDYLVAAPNYPTLGRQAVPELKTMFETRLRLGRLNLSPLEFRFSDYGLELLGWEKGDREPRILFAHVVSPDTMESMTVKAAWIDEAGMPAFRLSAWDGLKQRLAVHRGRVLITSKPYAHNWLKTHVYDPWQEARREGRDHPDIDVINFGSAANPMIHPDEVEAARASLPRWKFRMHWLGLFERPAGLIYGLDEETLLELGLADDPDPFGRLHLCDAFQVPASWDRYGGLDFGGVNTAAVILARNPQTGQRYIIEEYLKGGLTARGHAAELVRLVRRGWRETSGERPPVVRMWVGGAKSEGQWRSEFVAAGIPVLEPAVSDVEVGIGRGQQLLAGPPPLKIFRTCERLVEEFRSYSREVDDAGNATEAIADKETFHLLDAYRYIATRLASGPKKGITPHTIQAAGRPVGDR